MNKRTVNEFRIPRSNNGASTKSTNANFNLQNQPECQNTHQYFRFRQHIQTNLITKLGEKNNKQSSDFSKKILYVGNFSHIVIQEDLNELFGFKTTSYLQKNMASRIIWVPQNG